MGKIKKEELLKFFAFLFLGIPFLIAFGSGAAGLTPLGRKQYDYNFTAMYIALGVNIICWSSGLTYRLLFSDKKTWWSWMLLYVCVTTIIPSAFGGFVINLIYAAFPTWIVIAPLGVMYVVAALLPFINEKLSETLHTEIFAPRSRIGRLIQISVLALAPIAGIFGAFLSGLAERNGGVMGYAIMGLFFHFLLVWGTISMAHQAWEHRPWQKAEKE